MTADGVLIGKPPSTLTLATIRPLLRRFHRTDKPPAHNKTMAIFNRRTTRLTVRSMRLQPLIDLNQIPHSSIRWYDPYLK
jgi:hypothetical protein